MSHFQLVAHTCMSSHITPSHITPTHITPHITSSHITPSHITSSPSHPHTSHPRTGIQAITDTGPQCSCSLHHPRREGPFRPTSRSCRERQGTSIQVPPMEDKGKTPSRGEAAGSSFSSHFLYLTIQKVLGSNPSWILFFFLWIYSAKIYLLLFTVNNIKPLKQTYKQYRDRYTLLPRFAGCLMNWVLSK